MAKSSIQLFEEIGRGGFGIVYRGKYGQNQSVAIKRIASSLSAEALKESELLKSLCHPNIVHYIDTITTNGNTSLVMEFIDGGSLKNFIDKNELSEIYWRTCRSLMTDVAYGMTYLHEKNLVHGDLKSLNILLKNDSKAVICDFGLTRTIVDVRTQNTESLTGTIRWLAPELCLLEPKKTSFASDVWAYGCVWLEIITKKPPWLDQYERELVLIRALSETTSESIFNQICQSQNAPPSLKDLLCKCCSWKKSSRPHFSTIIKELKSIVVFNVDESLEKPVKQRNRSTNRHVSPVSNSPSIQLRKGPRGSTYVEFSDGKKLYVNTRPKSSLLSKKSKNVSSNDQTTTATTTTTKDTANKE